ncbi:rhodanese-like domain-containing protein [Limnoglobus roseus]|uniref:Rhodanese-like domain-containing protein n=1 Tax=Limnoglobus roseus TaxID=2598579 RepID=A0A5C1AJ52_9BACT|nr:rhodanese-like domain-containing protein [Limnoglobus roseus]QEL19201.1 rhodanese-like domain-containing protein [Limnoglobus roseus]
MRHAIVLTAAFAIVAGFSPVRAEEQTFPNITHDELTKAIKDKKVTLIDVNGSDSYKQGHIPTALNYDEIEKDLAKKLPEDKGALVVAYCGSEKCTAYRTAAAAAKKLGYTNVKHYAKGIAGWKASGEKVDAVK